MPADLASKDRADDMADGITPFELVVSEFLLRSCTLSRQHKQSMLKEELNAFDFSANAADAKDVRAIQRREALTSAMEAVSAGADTATLREGAELLTVTTDLDGLYDLLDASCVMELSYKGKKEHAAAAGADAVIDELCEQQESILGCRGDLAARRSSTGSGPSRRRNSGNNSNSSSTVVRAVSEVKSWVCATTLQPSPQVGTQITFYADTEKTLPVFSLHTVCTFTADGRKVERVSRTLLCHDAFNEDAVLKEIHFGPFGGRH